MYYLKDMETGLYYNAEFDGWVGDKLRSTAYPDLAVARESRRLFNAGDFPDGIKIVRPKSLHNWAWAWEQMRRDRVVRRASWTNPDACLVMTDKGQVLLRTNCAETNWSWHDRDTDATDWEVK